MRLLAPAKINLHLRVGPPRADGFHPLLSWMCTVGLFDTLIIDPSRQPGFHLSCDVAGLACDASNLVAKAAVAFAEAIGRESFDAADPERGDGAQGLGSSPGTSPQTRLRTAHGEGGPSRPGLSATLLKRIPVGAGLGGGSSDGARILQALNVLFNARWPDHRLAELASRFGSDLPFFFHAPSAVCTGRGEIVAPAPAPSARSALLILPARAMPTPAVYRQFDELNLGDETRLLTEPDWRHWATLPAERLLPLLVNDLEAPAFVLDPELGRLRRDVEQTLAQTVRMSGSGSSLFTLFDAEPDARVAAALVARRHAVRAVAVEVAPQIQDDFNTPEVTL